MKLVREHMNERFKEDSDPVKDMKIGFDGLFDTSYVNDPNSTWQPFFKFISKRSFYEYQYFIITGNIYNEKIIGVAPDIDEAKNIIFNYEINRGHMNERFKK